MDEQLDPLHKVELAMLRAEHQKRFRVMIEYIKEKVGKGIEYRNAVARVVVSEHGAYFELNDLPEEFSGAANVEVQQHFVMREAAVALLTRIVDVIPHINPENTRQFSLFALYARRGLMDRKNCYIYEYYPPDDHPRVPPLEIGRFQPEVMPLFYKVKIDADFALDILDINRGVAFCMATAGDRHLLIRIPYEGDQVTDLTNLPITKTIH